MLTVDLVVVFLMGFFGGTLGGFLGVWLGWTVMFVESSRREHWRNPPDRL